MKRFVCLLLCLLLLLVALPVTALAGDAPLQIAPAAGATEQDRAAAETLRQTLAQLLPTAPVTGTVTDADFIIGGVPEGEALPAGGYCITRKNGGPVSIAGTGSMGVQNGVYAFLRDYCGCRWYAGEAIVVPTEAALDLPDEIDRAHTPYFEYTYTDEALLALLDMVDRFLFSGVVLKLLHIVGVRQKTHIKDHICISGDSVLESEGYDRDDHI